MNKKKKSPKGEKDYFIRQVSKFSPNRLHIEIPSEHTKNFKPGDYAQVKKIKIRDKNERKSISLFGGIGGFDLALIRNGWECRTQAILGKQNLLTKTTPLVKKCQ